MSNEATETQTLDPIAAMMAEVIAQTQSRDFAAKVITGDEVEFHNGSKIGLPQGMTYGRAKRVLTRLEEEAETLTHFSHTFRYRPDDGAYAARQLALSVLQEVDADECEVQLAYAIGVPEPVSILVNTYGAVSPQTEDHIARTILKNVDLTPAGIIQRLDLKTPRYETTARRGHFGHKDYPWEAPIPLFS